MLKNSIKNVLENNSVKKYKKVLKDKRPYYT